MSATELWPIKCTFQRFTDYVDIWWRSAARGPQRRVWCGISAIFQLQASISRKR